MTNAEKINWLTIKQNNNYEISNNGMVRNKLSKRILKPAISNKGYYKVANDFGLMHSLVGNLQTVAIRKQIFEGFDK